MSVTRVGGDTPRRVFDPNPKRNYRSSINTGDEPAILAAGGNHILTVCYQGAAQFRPPESGRETIAIGTP
jgi:hypothetical protein